VAGDAGATAAPATAVARLRAGYPVGNRDSCGQARSYCSASAGVVQRFAAGVRGRAIPDVARAEVTALLRRRDALATSSRGVVDGQRHVRVVSDMARLANIATRAMAEAVGSRA
jgi:hypothetical protein